MSAKVPVPCPGCPKILNVSAEHCGRRVICPKCKTEFRVPKLEDVLPIDASHQSFGLQMSGEYELAPEAPRPKFERIERKIRNVNRTEMSLSDRSLQSSGIFLVMVPILAAVLPLMGLQLRRLAKVGEYAPLAAISLGIIGAVMIAYARRNRGAYDAAMAAMSAVMFSLIFGVGGFLFQRHQNQIALNQPDSNGAQENSGSQDNEARPHLPARSPEEAMNRLPEAGRPKHGATDSAAQAFRDIPGAKNDLDEDEHRSGFRSPSLDSPPAANSKSADGHSKNVKKVEIPSMVSNPDLMKLYLRSESNFRTEFSGQRNYQLKHLVGAESESGNFYTDHCQSLGVYTKMRELMLMPASFSDRDDDELQENLIRPEEGESLGGLRFAFSNDKIVGVQGLIKSSIAATMVPTKWIGTETTDLRESLNPDPEKANIVCFSSKGKFIGFAWAVKK